MKKLLILMTAMILVLSLASAALATTIYLDKTLGGKKDNSYITYPYNPVYLGADIPLGSWKINMEYSPNAIWYNKMEQISSYSIKFGYLPINNDSFKLCINLGLYNAFDSKVSTGVTNYSYCRDYTYGLDATFKFSDQWILFATYDSRLDGNAHDNYTHLYYKLNKLTIANVKLSYYFNDNWGLTAGYRYINEQAGSWPTMTFKGYTLGMAYKF